MDSKYAEETEPRGWFERLHLIWPMLFLVGWVLYELTTQSTVGAVAVCLKFGWEDFRAAIWLRRVDPWRLRGRACFWLYLASGLAKMAGVAFLMSLAFAAVMPKGPAAQGPRLRATVELIVWTWSTMVAGLSCAVGTLVYALILAWWGRFKLWLSRDLHLARIRNDWPPYGPICVQNNRLAFLFVCARIGDIIPWIICFCVGFIIALQSNDGFALVISMGGVLFISLCYPMLILLLGERIHRRLVASHPCECWDDDAVSSPDAESIAEMSGNPIK